MIRIIRFQLCMPAHKHFVCNIIVNFNIIKKKRLEKLVILCVLLIWVAILTAV